MISIYPYVIFAKHFRKEVEGTSHQIGIAVTFKKKTYDTKNNFGILMTTLYKAYWNLVCIEISVTKNH